MSFVTIGDSDLDPLLWAKKPKSHHALQAVFDCATVGDPRFVEIKASLIRDGVCDESGRMVRRWDGNRWAMVGERTRAGA
jgi:hypothetical protein